MRESAVSGSFYPNSELKIKEIITNSIKNIKKEINSIGVVTPHAGYEFCAKVLAYSYINLKEFETAVIIGPNHYGRGVSPALSKEEWKTPLGIIKPDKEFIDNLVKEFGISVDETAHKFEHSIEVQIPWIQTLYPKAKIVPICLSSFDFEISECKKLGNSIAETAKSLNKNIIIVASSDFTHYGLNYGYTPFGNKISQILKGMKEIDMKVAESITKIMPEKVIEDCKYENLTICGYGCISAMLWTAKALGAKSGKVLNYSTSFEVSKNSDAIVGYCSIGIY
ncbi:MAG: AmmeMemoRadiSam system protein B [Candidatus Aenigmatarchaeota archaeon]|nr:AmmeMemoRadiSam system protein B [Candidatus Aenigmarchaeota archaeon]